jgi:hypothetical protein
VADIRVEPRRPGAWPWIAGLIVLALLIWGLTRLLGGDDDVVVDQAVPPAPTAPAPASP